MRGSPVLVEQAIETGHGPASDVGWVRLGEHNVYLAYRYLEVMCQMNRASYATDQPEKIVRRMVRFPCEYYYYAGSNSEVVLGYKWKKRHWRVMSVGFTGAITPGEALDLVVQQGQRFFTEKGIERVVAVEPAKMENPGILEFYRLMRQHPGLEVRGTHRLTGGTYLWVRVRLGSERARSG